MSQVRDVHPDQRGTRRAYSLVNNMKIKPEVIEKTLARLTAAAGDDIITLSEFTAALSDDTGVELPAKVVRAALDECPFAEVKKIGTAICVEYHSPERRAEWKRADELAAALGGSWSRENDPQIITLTMNEAEALVAKLTAKVGAVLKTVLA